MPTVALTFSSPHWKSGRGKNKLFGFTKIFYLVLVAAATGSPGAFPNKPMENHPLEQRSKFITPTTQPFSRLSPETAIAHSVQVPFTLAWEQPTGLKKPKLSGQTARPNQFKFRIP